MNDNVWKGEPLKRMGYLVKLDKCIEYLNELCNPMEKFRKELNGEERLKLEMTEELLKKHKLRLLEESESEAIINLVQ
jgi:hypothetical protein